MPRIRYIKPDFFKDEDLCCLDHKTRLFFAGLWCYADRNGRLDYRPKYLKMEIFPHEDFDVVAALEKLESPNIPERPKKKFIIIYEVEEKKYIQIGEFSKHQRPHHTEKESIIPAYIGSLTVKTTLPIVDAPKVPELPNSLKKDESVNGALNNGYEPPENGDGEGNGKGKGNQQGAVVLLNNSGNDKYRNHSVRDFFIQHGFPYENMNTENFQCSWLRLLDWFASLPPVGYLDVQGQESKLRKLNEFGKSESQYIAIISKTIEKKWKDIYPMDEKGIKGTEKFVVKRRKIATDG